MSDETIMPFDFPAENPTIIKVSVWEVAAAMP